MIIHIKKHKTAIFIITLLSLILLPILVFTLGEVATINNNSVCVGLENGDGNVVGISISDENAEKQDLSNYCFDQDKRVVFTCTDGEVNNDIFEALDSNCFNIDDLVCRVALIFY